MYWRHYVDDWLTSVFHGLMLVTDSVCWCCKSSQISQSCHQLILSSTSVTNINVAVWQYQSVQIIIPLVTNGISSKKNWKNKVSHSIMVRFKIKCHTVMWSETFISCWGNQSVTYESGWHTLDWNGWSRVETH